MVATGKFWERLERFPPILIRLLARSGPRKALSDDEIAERSGLPLALVASIGHSTTWEGVDVPTFRAFTSACGLDLTNREQVHRADVYLAGSKNGADRRPPMYSHLKHDPLWKSHYLPLLKKYHLHLSRSQ